MVIDLLTIWLGKAVYSGLRLVGRHGGALPGLIVERLNPNLIKKLSGLPDGIIVVSGTNGKTTTTSLVTQVLKRSGRRVFTNHSGSNMTRGILASIIRFSSMSGHLNYDVAVLELDEAYAAKLGPKLSPNGVLLTNVLRDQLDRFGEIDHTAKLLYKLAESCSGVVAYNVSDSRLAKLDNIDTSTKKISYGFDVKISDNFVDDDTLYGGDKKKISADYLLKDYKNSKVYFNKLTIDVTNLHGWHNALNTVGVYALLSELYEITDTKSYEGLFPPYGRGEQVSYKGTLLTLQLVKNPAGFKTVLEVDKDLPAMIVINDNIADGRDVSWLWDVDFTNLCKRPSVSCSGVRAFDMALRLNYDEIKSEHISTDIGQSLEHFVTANNSGIIFLTYTSMLQVRTYLKKHNASFGGDK